VGENNTVGDQILVNGLINNVTINLGQYYYDTDGLQDGWGLEKSIYEATVNVMTSPGSAFFVQGRDSDRTQGDLSQNFFEEVFPTRFLQDRQLARAGGRFAVSPDVSVAAIVSYQDLEDETQVPPGQRLFIQRIHETSIDLQSTLQLGMVNMVFGANHYSGDGSVNFGFGPFSFESDADSLYTYATATPRPWVTLQLGVSGESLSDPAFESEFRQVNPKGALIVRPATGTTVRIAGLRTLRRPLIGEQTIEPTQVGGFNQFYDDSLGTSAERYGIGLDQRIRPGLYFGGELSKRRLRVPQPVTFPQETFEWNERDDRAYLYWTVSRRVAMSVEYSYERITEDPLFAEAFLDVRTHKLPLMVSWFPSSRLSLRAVATGVRQSGTFRQGLDFADGSSDFWLLDLGVTYHLPRRRGHVSVEVRNAFDERFLYQETDILTPTLARERLLFGRLSLAF
jgi:hypothetical protein